MLHFLARDAIACWIISSYHLILKQVKSASRVRAGIFSVFFFFFSLLIDVNCIGYEFMIPPEETIFPSLLILISHFSKKIFFNLHMLLSF